MSLWTNFLSKENFILAWRRVNTGTSIYYKRFFREALTAYEIACEENIENLISRIKNNTYVPYEPDKLFMPKSSGLQRPITLLSIEDQIVYQALANVIARKWQAKRQPLEYKVVFSNIFNTNPIFMFENYKKSYSKFTHTIAANFVEGNAWVAHFDLAAFFDTISHDCVRRMVHWAKTPSEIADLMMTVLKAWTSKKQRGLISHGIPQGPLASSLIGELVFYDIDKIMSSQQVRGKYVYLRYVDDIRIMARDEDSVRRGLIRLEQLCRHMGLIPQSSKTAVFQAEDESHAVGKNISFSKEENDPSFHKDFLLKCLSEDKLTITDTSRFKYYLYRVKPSASHLDVLFPLFLKQRDMCDIFQIHFENYKKNEALIRALEHVLVTRDLPYQYFEGVIWQILSTIDLQRITFPNLARIAGKRLMGTTADQMNYNLRRGLLLYLFPKVNSTSKRILNKYLYEPSSILQGQLVNEAKIFMNRDNYSNFIRRCLIRSLPDSGLVAAIQLAIDNEGVPEGVSIAQLKPAVQNVLAKLGLIQDDSVKPYDPFDELIERRYRVKCSQWKELLSSEYDHAHKLLAISDSSFDQSPSNWLCHLDTLNEVITRSIINRDPNITAATKDKNGHLVDYGQFLEITHPFYKNHPGIADVFKQIHKRRCCTPGAHAYDKKTTKRTRPVKPGERNNFMSKISTAYEEISKFAVEQFKTSSLATASSAV